MKLLWHLAAVCTAALALGGCTLTTRSQTPTATLPPPSATPVIPTATPLPLDIRPTVERVDVLVTVAEITAVIRGTLPSDCWQIGEPTEAVRGGTIFVELLASRPEDAPCAAVLQPFESRLILPADTLADGFYVLTINDETSSSFTYDGQSLAAAGTLVISGQVWHDVCAWQAGEPVEQPLPGCQVAGDEYRGNGQFEETESGLAQVLVELGLGECPTAPLLSTITDQSGRYTFPAVGAGQYCVMILTSDNSNELLLAPGIWTAPAEFAGEQDAYVTVNAATDELHFGWDYTLLPRSTNQTACTDKALLIEDVTYPAGTRVRAGETLTKTWRVQNVGTCTWTTDYSLQWVEGRVDAPDETSLPRPILPGEMAEISIMVTTPQGFGTFRGAWWLKSSTGILFGTGINGDRTLMLEVIGPAPPPTATPLPEPTAVEEEQG